MNIATSRSYEPSLSVAGEPLDMGNEPEIAPGVRGYAIESDGWIFIPLVIGAGDGSVGRFLDSVTPRCVFPTVISPRLRGMLERRGFSKVWFDDAECYVLTNPTKP